MFLANLECSKSVYMVGPHFDIIFKQNPLPCLTSLTQPLARIPILHFSFSLKRLVEVER